MSRYALLLAVPFLIGIAVLKGLTVEIDTFHGSDARVYQLPTILHFRHGLDFADYPSAQTPLFHLVMAGWGKLVGFDLWRLRLLNVAISYGAVLALLRLLRRTTGLADPAAFGLTLAFALSPFFFGASFTLLTDNLATLFALLALERLDAYAREGSPAAFTLACAAIAGAVLTRQSFLWLVAVALFFLVRRPIPLARLAAGGATLAVALAPLAALVVEWHGLVPPSADPASCGLCTDRPGVGRDAFTLRAVGFTLAVLGLYAAVLLFPFLLRRLRGVPRLALAGIVVAVVLLLIEPLEYIPIAPGQLGDAGYLWKVSDHLPSVLGSSLVFWALVPLGAVAAALLSRRAGRASLPTVYLGAFLLTALPVRLVYQKYFDPFMLLAVALYARPPDFRRALDYAGVALVCVAGVAYALSFAG
jgi:Dolichyl-phosphate-mannose-protein mannosyltransferase